MVTCFAAAGVCAPGCRRQAAPPPITMRIGVGTPPTSRATADSGIRQLANLIQSDALLANTPDQKPVERIATAWQWDAAGTTLRLTLRHNVYLHDGTKLTADIVAGSLRSTAASQQSIILKDEDVVSIAAEAEDVVAIRIKAPNSFLLGDLASVAIGRPDKPDVGTGPYRVVGREPGKVHMVAFPQYFRGAPGLAGIDISSYPTQRNAWAALMRGDIDMLYEVSKEAADFVRAEQSVRTYSFPRPYYIPLAFNVRRKVFTDPRVRQAINMAVDREALVRDGMNGRGSPADGPLSPQNWAYVRPAHPFAYDPAGARTLLDAAGFKVRPSKDSPVPVRFSFECVVFANDPRFDRIEVVLQKQLAEVGIEMRIVPLSLDDLMGRVGTGEFDAFVFEMSGRFLGWVYEFWRSRPNMRANTGYTAADAVLNRIKAARTDDQVLAAVPELNQIFHDDPPAAFLAFQEQTRAASTKFDLGTEEKRDILANLWQWRAAVPR